MRPAGLALLLAVLASAPASTLAAAGEVQPVLAEDFREACAEGPAPRLSLWRVSGGLDRALRSQRLGCRPTAADGQALRIEVRPGDAYDPNPGGNPTERVEIQARQELVQFDRPVWYAFRFRLQPPWTETASENRTVIHQVKQNIEEDHEIAYGGHCPSANPFFKIEAGYRAALSGPGFVVKVRGTENCRDGGAPETVCGPWPLAAGAWHRVRVALKPSQRAGTGYLQVWLDGRACPVYRGIFGYVDFGKRLVDGTPFIDAQPRFGIYRDALPGQVQAIELAELLFWDADPAGDRRWDRPGP